MILASLVLPLIHPQSQGSIIEEPIWAPGANQAWACETPVIYQGSCPSDHAGLSMDAGADWNGDGVPDVVLGGGAKVDLEGQSSLIDSKRDAVTLFLGGLDNTVVTINCPPITGSSEAPPTLYQPLQFSDVRLRGIQYDDGTETATNKERWMLSDRFGWCVRFVGDINGPQPAGPGEGTVTYPDLAVGAPWYDVDVDLGGGATETRHQAGAVYLYFGRPQPTGDPAVPGDPIPKGSYAGAESETLTSSGGYCDFILLGESAGDYFEFAISKEIDFDGDGIHDLAIGAPQYAWQDGVNSSATTTNAAWPNIDNRPGKVYVVFGDYLRTFLASSSANPVLRISQALADGGALTISDPLAADRDRFGASLDGIGDHDIGAPFIGDELVIGAPQFRSDWNKIDDQNPAPNHKKTPQFFGDDGDGGPGYVTVWSLEDLGSGTYTASRRGRIDGPADADSTSPDEVGLEPRFGRTVSRIALDRTSAAVGFAVGAPGFDALIDPNDPPAGTFDNIGMVMGCTFDPTSPTQPISTTFSFTGYQAQSDFGSSLASSGDYNADAIPDLIVGSKRYTRLGVPPACSCSGARPGLAGRVDVLSWTQVGGTPRSRVLGAFYGEEARDRLGFASAFLGPIPGLAGGADTLVSAGFAWPFKEAPTQVTDGLCADCTSGMSCPTFTELGRAYLFHRGMGQ